MILKKSLVKKAVTKANNSNKALGSARLYQAALSTFFPSSKDGFVSLLLLLSLAFASSNFWLQDRHHWSVHKYGSGPEGRVIPRLP